MFCVAFLDNLFIDRVVIEFDENNNVDGIVVTVSIPTSGKIAGLLELTNAEAIIRYTRKDAKM